MTGGVRVGVGTRFQYDGEVVTVVELIITLAGNEVVLQNSAGTLTARIALRDLLTSDRATLIPDSADADDEPMEPATVVLAELSPSELQNVRERAAHVREVLTGYRAGLTTRRFSASRWVREAMRLQALLHSLQLWTYLLIVVLGLRGEATG